MRLSPKALERLLAQAVTLDRGALEDVGDGTRRLTPPASWQRLVDTSLRRRSASGAVPRLVFDSAAMMQQTGERSVFRERPDRVLVRLGHPVMRRATTTLRRRLWESDPRLQRFTIVASDAVSKPTLVVYALLQLTSGLREPLHAELVEIAVALDDPGRQLEVPAWDDVTALADADLVIWAEHLEDQWDELAENLTTTFNVARQDYIERAEALLPAARTTAIAYQRELFKTRLRELDDDRGEKGREKLRRDLAKEEASLAQMTFDRRELEHEERARRLRDIIEGEEYRRIETRRERLRERVERERDSLIEEVLPRRYTLARCTLTPAAVALIVPVGSRP